MVSFKSNAMERIDPAALGPQLRWLILTDNRLECIPTEIGRCRILQKLMLSGNRLTRLPSEITNCTALELVRIASNQLEEPPIGLLSLPNLAWVALSGNPFLLATTTTTTTTTTPPLPLPNLSEVAVDGDEAGVLGSGASGITRRGILAGRGVAVKMYAAEMTSDGDPREEKQIAVAASALGLASLVEVLGQTPGGALVMELLEGYTTVGQPPSMRTCTRDMYPPEQTLAPGHALAIAHALVTTLQPLHLLGISHSDLYMHNTLWAGGGMADKGPGAVKLSDFGAAFFYDTQAEYAGLVQRAELRALGHAAAELNMLQVRHRAPGDDVAGQGAPSATVVGQLLAGLRRACFGGTSEGLCTVAAVAGAWGEAVDEALPGWCRAPSPRAGKAGVE